MAGFAFGTQLPLMRIILAVTRDAGALQLVTINVTGVAGLALGGGVLAAQGELGRPVVIERALRPFDRRVTRFAFLAASTGVLVLGPMASDACRADATEFLASMTRRTGR